MVARVGQPEDIAWCATYLASDEACWVTAADFSIDGALQPGDKRDRGNDMSTFNADRATNAAVERAATLQEAKARFRGTLVWRDESDYEEARVGRVFNARKPERFPSAVLFVESVDDVVAGVQLACEHNLTIIPERREGPALASKEALINQGVNSALSITLTPVCRNSSSIRRTDPSRSIARHASRMIVASSPSLRASSAEKPTQ